MPKLKFVPVKSKPKTIPKGYRRLKPGTFIKEEDQFFSDDKWIVTNNEGCQVRDSRSPFVYIRRIKKRKAKK